VTARSASAFIVLLGVLGAIFLAFHLPYLPRSLEDLDSVNFALGLRQFDVAHHQPHPPGYPVFIAIGKVAHEFVPDEARALSLVSMIAGALGVVAIGALFRRLDHRHATDAWAVAATALAIASPLYWFTAARPLSDMTGLAAAVAVQAMTLTAASSRGLAVAAVAAGVATGIRSQVAWLTMPLLIVRGLGDWGVGGLRKYEVRSTKSEVRSTKSEVGNPQSAIRNPQSVAPQSPGSLVPPLVSSLLWFSCGVLSWFVPLVIVTGGPAAYWHALSNQGAEDFGNISMLWTTHNLRAVADAAYFRFVAPWGTVPVAVLMLALAVAGVAVLVRRNRGALFALATAFGPYLLFDLLFQETFTGRYALPGVIPMAFLATAALQGLPWRSGLAVAVVVSIFDGHVSGTSVAAFAREKAPAFRLIDDMRSAAQTAPEPPVLAMDRRNSFDFRRPIVWTGGAIPQIARQLSAPPQHEWLEAVNYWNSGGRAPVWFVVDPKRAAMELVQHGDPIRYRWQLPSPDLVSGARPNEMDWYRVDRPEWYVGEGWSLTPEAAGVADADHRGVAYGPIPGWMDRRVTTMLVGGRNFETHSVHLVVEPIDEFEVPPGPFVRLWTPRIMTAIPNSREPDYVTLKIFANTMARVAIEQFDASTTRTLVGFGSGWHEPEFNPRSGLRWRWLSERGQLELSRPARGLTLHIEGESPRRYFDRPSRLSVASADIVNTRDLSGDFSLDFRISDGADRVFLATDQVYVPAERSRRSQDRRHLGLRIFTCEIR
jgi:hypothetical protein